MTAIAHAPEVDQAPEDIFTLAQMATFASQELLKKAIAAVRAKINENGKISPEKMINEQRAVHGLAWLATSVECVRELTDYMARLTSDGVFSQTEELLVKIGLGETLAQIAGGIVMSPNEIVRLSDLSLDQHTISVWQLGAVDTLIAQGNTAANRVQLMRHMLAHNGQLTVGHAGLDETLDAIRQEIRRYTIEEIEPFAHEWHMKNAYIPMSVIESMAELGVFGLTIPEEFGGMGMSKVAMCVVSEELSRGYIGVGSLGTRSEIAAELILAGGTDAQKQTYLPQLAIGAILPTAVFTEPNTGSDLASLQTRAVLEDGTWKIYGNKTWITHPVRADLMTVLVRTNPEEAGHKGLSMLLAQKPRGTDEHPFPVEGLTGGEIEVLGYRGMKEYELAFDGFSVSGDNLLGGTQGQGFKQLMQTFESARIQTAARAVGVAQNAFELGLRYAQERIQFGAPIITFPRVADKLVMMAVEINIARQLTYFSARAKDQDKRCDLEAGMAKLYAARVAWSSADNALQIHGGNGFALEYPISRVLCDARILSIFEGASEIQAQVIARRLLEM